MVIIFLKKVTIKHVNFCKLKKIIVLRMKFPIFLVISLFSFANAQDPHWLFPRDSWAGQIVESVNDYSRNAISQFLISVLASANWLVRLVDQYVLNQDDLVWDTTEDPRDEYDFIVVGAGSTGSVIAARLSEIFSWSVLVLEAGMPETELVDIPLLAASFQGGMYDWTYVTEPQEFSGWGMEDRRIACPRGKALGGSSVLNLMIYSRGTKEDYDEIAKLGNEGWSYADILPYFLKSEGAGDLFKMEKEYHNSDGPLSVENTYMSPLVTAMIEGGEEIEWPLYDYNAPVGKYGVCPTQATLKNGRRFSAGRAYLAPASKRTNLDIVIEALVTKILIDEKTKTAYGVTYEIKGQEFTVKARKEVIVCAGTINSPQLLMLSGIGPKKQLELHNIKVLKNLPGVGSNLKDHLVFYGVLFKLLASPPDHMLRTYLGGIGEFVFYGKGPLITLGGCEGIGFIRTNVNSSIPVAPDIEYFFLRGSIGTDHETFMKKALRLTDDLYDTNFRPIEDDSVWCVAPVLLHPQSTGDIKLRSKDPHDHPLIDPNYFSDPDNRDIKRMIAGIRFVQQLEYTKAFAAKGAKINDIPMYGCEDLVFDSDKYWECALRTLSTTLYHPMGTCKMGPKTDKMAVVDNKLKVYGIKNLRVADISILSWMSGHTNAPAMMIGEKISDEIKDKHL